MNYAQKQLSAAETLLKEVGGAFRHIRETCFNDVSIKPDKARFQTAAIAKTLNELDCLASNLNMNLHRYCTKDATTPEQVYAAASTLSKIIGLFHKVHTELEHLPQDHKGDSDLSKLYMNGRKATEAAYSAHQNIVDYWLKYSRDPESWSAEGDES